MPLKSTSVDKLKNQADWYATSEGRRQTQREFAKALTAGTLIRSQGLKVAKTDGKILEELMNQAKERATRAISIRIPIADLERAKQAAQKAGVGYQKVLKQAIREGLNGIG